MNKKYAQFLINKTQADYNLISDDFATARQYLTDDLKELSLLAKDKEIVLDAGCGSGYLYSVLEKTKYIGVDFSEKLINIAKKRYPEACFKKDNILNLDLPDNYFDKIFTIGVLHQIPSKKLRLKFLQQLHKKLKPNGVLVIRVWNLWEKKRKLILKYMFLKLIRKTKLDMKDVFLLNNMYYHAFTEKELKKIVKKSGFFVEKSYIQGKGVKSNIYLIAQKKVAVF